MALLVGVLVGGGLMLVAPAGAQVQQAVATNWKKIWREKLQPQADKRYARSGSSYTKAESDARFEGAGSGYSKVESDARFEGAGSGYSKVESDARYAPVQQLYRGTIQLLGHAAATGDMAGHGVSFGATFPSAPTPHYIQLGDPIPVGCSGTAEAPNAAPGHLCVFETAAYNLAGSREICRAAPSAECPATDPFGAAMYAVSGGSGLFYALGTWAARPSGPVVNPGFVPADSGAVNGAKSGGAPAWTP